MNTKELLKSKSFYRKVLAVSVPVMIQNGITNFVGLLDNIMVGRIGTDEMSGVSIANQLLMVFNLCIFGAVSGASIFGAQFFGKKDYEGMTYTMRFRLYVCLGLCALGITVFLAAGEPLILAFLQGEEGVGNAARTLEVSKEYLAIMLTGLVPFTISQCYSSIMREIGDTIVPMVSGIAAVAVNLVFNYILIFGEFGAPRLGAAGAAIATVLSRVVEALIVVIWSHTHRERYRYIKGLYRSFHIPAALMKKIAKKGAPLIVNETLWSAGMAMLNQCYSVRGLEVIAAMNIASTINNLFYVVFIALGNSVAIVVGPMLGANEMDEAKHTAKAMIVFATMSCFLVGAVLVAVAPFFPLIYKTEESVRSLASSFIVVCACCMSIYGFVHATYFTLRSGGKTFITFLFDSAFVWAVNVPVAFIISRFTGMPIVWLFLCVQLTDLIKCVVGWILVKKGIWLNNIVEDKAA
ncbi:MAG: MATE family efflux transporter [Lachnospiraceae bacterium]|nr:MATE family efflux transporter [Lachnospiraceae bacterium]